MSSDRNWRQLNSNIKAAFGKLTDDDLLQADGNTDKMMGALQKRYGYTKSKAQSEWNKFADRCVDKVEAIEDDIDAAVNALKAAASPTNDRF